MILEKNNKDSELFEKDFINFLKQQGVIVKTNTKARGNLGFYLKNRIYISKDAPKNKRISILAHEYAHKIHHDIDPDDFYKGGNLEKLFNTKQIKIIKDELVAITNFIDKNSCIDNHSNQKQELKIQIKELEELIKQDYPDFIRSQTFKPVNTFFRKHKSAAKYLLKYDNIKINNSFLFIKKEEEYSIQEIDKDFPEIPVSIRAYIKLKSLERKHNRLSRYICKLNKYYNKPTELFARFVQGLFIDKNAMQKLAPKTYEQFYNLLNIGYYGKLKDFLNMANLN